MKKTLATFLALFVLLPLLQACSGKDEPCIVIDGDTTLRMDMTQAQVEKLLGEGEESFGTTYTYMEGMVHVGYRDGVVRMINSSAATSSYNGISVGTDINKVVPGFAPTLEYEQDLTTYYREGKVVEDSHLVASLPPEEREQVIAAGYYHSNGVVAYVFVGDMKFLREMQ